MGLGREQENMMNQGQLLKRVEYLEREMRDVRSLLSGGAAGARRSYRDYIGMFHNDPDFKKAMEAGARYRRSLRPKAPKRRAAKR